MRTQPPQTLWANRLFFLLFFLLLTATASWAASSRTFTYTLTSSCRSSCGVFDSNGTLIRTLWSGKIYPIGQHSIEWDGNYDNHYGIVNPAPEGIYTLKVLTNNVQYNWDGEIGNTSNGPLGFLGESVWKSLCPPGDFAINANGIGVAALGYAEGPATVKRFSTSNPQSPTDFAGAGDVNLYWNYTAIDGTRAYFAATGDGFDTNNSNLVVAYNLSDNSSYLFSSGTTCVCSFNSYTYRGVIDVSQKIGTTLDTAFRTLNMATGLSVQQTGNVLAVSHGGLNLVKFFNKVSGAFLNQISITNPGRITFAPNGDLWAISGTTLSCFDAATLGQTDTPKSTITGLTSPIAVAIDPADNNKLLVMDGGASQQVKCYTYNSGWTLLWALGQAGGYNATNGPDVTTNKFWFTTTTSTAVGSGILAFQSDSSFWVGDGGNCRVLHFDSDQNYLEQIAYIPGPYRICADVNVPSRVIGGGRSGLLEFQIDYTKPLIPGDPGNSGAWKLVKNWGAGLDTTTANGFESIATVSGHTYAELALGGSNQLVELPSSGMVRFLGRNCVSRQHLTSNGDLLSGVYNSTSSSFYRYAGTGFDTGNPTWASNGTLLASAPTNQFNDPTPLPGGAGTRIAITTSNRIISFNTQGADTTIPGSFHLGAIAVTGTNWLWRSSPGCKTLSLADTGTNGDGSFSTVGYGGLCGVSVFADGQNVLYGFNGQYAPYSNQYLHFYDNGLFVGQFGVNGDSTMPGTCGNVQRMAMVRSGTTLYVYTTDENTHGALQRFSITGLDSIIEFAGAVTSLPADPSNLTAAPLPISSTQMKLTWSDKSSTETGFIIERATDSNFTQNLTTVVTGSGVTSYTDTVPSTFVQYYYRIKSTNASGNSGYTYATSSVWDGCTGLQQGRNGYFGVHDTYLSNYCLPPTYTTNYSFGKNAALCIFERSGSGGENARSLISFDLTSVVGTITSAQLVLTKSGQSPNGSSYYNETIALYRVSDANKDWEPGTGSYSQQNGAAVWNYKADQLSGTPTPWAGTPGLSTVGTDYVATALATASSGTTLNTAVTWTFNDVSFLNDWKANPSNEAGFFLKEINPRINGWDHFYSSDAATVTYRPMLLLTVTPDAPTFSPVSGTYNTPQTVSIGCTTPGVTIRYTTDGSEPSDTVGTTYTSPILIPQDTTLKAVSYAVGMTLSSITSGSYVITQCATPTYSPGGGTFSSTQTVAISCVTPGATIRYTTDGSTPTQTVGTVYSSPVVISSSCTLKAIAYKTGLTDSAVASDVYDFTYQTITLQQGVNNYTGAADSSISNWYRPPQYTTNLSFGGNGEIWVFERSAGGGENARSLIRFDLSGITGTIIAAQLVLTKSYQSANGSSYYNENIAVYRVADANKDWLPGTASYAQQNGAAVWNQKSDPSTPWAGSAGLSSSGTDYVATALATATTGVTVNVPITWTFNDVSFLNDWKANPANNAGFFLKEINPVINGGNRFYSSNNSNVSYRPKLVLTVIP